MRTTWRTWGWMAVWGAMASPAWAAPAPVLEVGTPLPGQPVTLTLQGATPGATVWMAWGTQPGPGPCPPAWGGVCLGVMPGGLLGSTQVDAGGVATLTVLVPAGVPIGQPVALQAVQTSPGPFLSGVTTTAVAHPDDVCVRTSGYWAAPSAGRECDVQAAINAARDVGGDCGAQGTFAPAAPLTMHAGLQMAARAQSWWIGQSGQVGHRSPGGPLGTTLADRLRTVGYAPWLRVGEDIGRGQQDVAAIMADWLRSDGHCANIFRSEYRDLGVGFWVDGQGREIWTAVFGAPQP